MSDADTIRSAAEAVLADSDWLPWDQNWDVIVHEPAASFIAACDPDTLLALLAENERLREALEGATAFRSIAAMKAADDALRRSRAAAVPEERE